MDLKHFTVNSSVKDQLEDLYFSNRVPHALLLNGNEGSGHLQLGIYLAYLLLCKSPNKSFCRE